MGLETRTVTREDFTMESKKVEASTDGKSTLDRRALATFIKLPTNWVPPKQYFRKDLKSQVVIERASVLPTEVGWSSPMSSYAPIEYNDPKLLTPEATSYADPADCTNPALAKDIQRRSAARVIKFQIDTKTGRPIVSSLDRTSIIYAYALYRILESLWPHRFNGSWSFGSLGSK